MYDQQHTSPALTKVECRENVFVISKAVLPTLVKIASPQRKKIEKDAHFYNYNSAA